MVVARNEPEKLDCQARRQRRAIGFWGLAMNRSNRTDHIRITSHPEPGGKLRFPIRWAAPTARERGPVIGTVSKLGDRNVIGSHGGSYALYRALAVSARALDPIRRPDLTNTYPAVSIGPFAQWAEPQRIVSLDPWGHLVAETFKTEIAEGVDIRPTIAITKARLDLHEMQSAVAGGRLKVDGDLVRANGSISRSRKSPSIRCGTCPASRERFGCHENDPAPHAVRTDRGHVPRARYATGPSSVPAADRRDDHLFVRRHRQAFRSRDKNHLPGPRRVQRLGRVRLRHLHLPTLPHPRHRGMRARRAGRRSLASSSIIARKAGHWAR